MSKQKKKEKKNADTQASAKPVDGVPETSFEYVNKYGTYEIQPTNGMQSDWPLIAQGLAQNYEKPTVVSDNEEQQSRNSEEDTPR